MTGILGVLIADRNVSGNALILKDNPAIVARPVYKIVAAASRTSGEATMSAPHPARNA
jgi:hypothetical protein